MDRNEAARAHAVDGRDKVGDSGSRRASLRPPPPPPTTTTTTTTTHLHSSALSQQHKERHIVTWSQQEDDLLREQVGILGTENWTCIAAQFKDKTGRQCRRRWYTYLSVECKRGGWSPEEDQILCEAQKIFGNRWTEIAKVVSGRTDNAVKNRFTTLRKKRAKQEASSKENRCLYSAGSGSELCSYLHRCNTELPPQPSSTLKKTRYQVGAVQDTRPPLEVLAHNNYGTVGGALQAQQHSADHLKAVQMSNGKALNSNSRGHGGFIKRDDPKISALLQQEELLRSLALKVYTDSTDQCLESAWKELKEYLIQNGERGLEKNELAQLDFWLDDFQDLIEDLRSSSIGSCPSARQTDFHEHSSHSSEFRVSPEHRPNAAEKENNHGAASGAEGKADQETELPNGSLDKIPAAVFSPRQDQEVDAEIFSALSSTEFSSPLQTIPIFSPFSDWVSTPKFSSSERHILLSILRLSSSSPKPSNLSQQPSCKRALLHSL